MFARGIARTEMQRAEDLRELKRAAESIQALRRAGAIYGAIAARDPRDGEVARDMAHVLQRLGSAYRSLGRESLWLDSMSGARKAFEALIASGKSRPEDQVAVASLLVLEAAEAGKRGDLVGAIALARREVTHQTALRNLFPAAAYVPNARVRLGQLLLRAGDRGGASREFEAALAELRPGPGARDVAERARAGLGQSRQPDDRTQPRDAAGPRPKPTTN